MKNHWLTKLSWKSGRNFILFIYFLHSPPITASIWPGEGIKKYKFAFSNFIFFTFGKNPRGGARKTNKKKLWPKYHWDFQEKKMDMQIPVLSYFYKNEIFEIKNIIFNHFWYFKKNFVNSLSWAASTILMFQIVEYLGTVMKLLSDFWVCTLLPDPPPPCTFSVWFLLNPLPPIGAYITLWTKFSNFMHGFLKLGIILQYTKFGVCFKNTFSSYRFF